MTNKIKKQIINAINEGKYLQELDISMTSHKTIEEAKTLEDLKNAMIDIINEQQDYIYFDDAMDFLKENDNMLTETFEIIEELGGVIKGLDSCILANLLLKKYRAEELEEIINSYK